MGVLTVTKKSEGKEPETVVIDIDKEKQSKKKSKKKTKHIAGELDGNKGETSEEGK